MSAIPSISENHPSMFYSDVLVNAHKYESIRTTKKKTKFQSRCEQNIKQHPVTTKQNKTNQSKNKNKNKIDTTDAPRAGQMLRFAENRRSDEKVSLLVLHVLVARPIFIHSILYIVKN